MITVSLPEDWNLFNIEKRLKEMSVFDKIAVSTSFSNKDCEQYNLLLVLPKIQGDGSFPSGSGFDDVEGNYFTSFFYGIKGVFG